MSDNRLFFDGFDAYAYWADKEFKKYVVSLEAGPKKSRVKQTVYVRARSLDIAVAVAKRVTDLKRYFVADARLARPRDLGCVATPARPHQGSAA